LSGYWELLKVFCSLGVTGSYLFIGSYWKLSSHGELLEIVWSLELLEIVWSWKVTGNCLIIGVTGSCLDIGSYWKFSGALGVTESCLVIGSCWKLSGHWELLEVFWCLPENFQ
jgi:hypothetical protein